MVELLVEKKNNRQKVFLDSSNIDEIVDYLMHPPTTSDHNTTKETKEGEFTHIITMGNLYLMMIAVAGLIFSFFTFLLDFLGVPWMLVVLFRVVFSGGLLYEGGLCWTRDLREDQELELVYNYYTINHRTPPFDVCCDLLFLYASPHIFFGLSAGVFLSLLGYKVFLAIVMARLLCLFVC